MLWLHFGVSTADVRLSTYDRPIMDMTYMGDMTNGPVIVHHRIAMEDPSSECFYPIQWPDDVAPIPDSLSFRMDPPPPQALGLHQAPPQPAHIIPRRVVADGIEELYMDQPPSEPPSRAGVRGSRRNIQDPRSQMIAWAMDKIQRRLPHINAATVLMLLKAKNRTVTATLNCKSDSQLADVIKAAHRRAGLHPPGEQFLPRSPRGEESEPDNDPPRNFAASARRTATST